MKHGITTASVATMMFSAAKAAAEAAQETVTNENAQGVLSGLFQTLSDNTPAIVSDAWNATVGEYPYVALATTAAAGLATAYALNRKSAAKLSRNGDPLKNTDDKTLVAKSDTGSELPSNDALSSSNGEGQRQHGSSSPSLRGSRSGSESD